MVMTAMTNWDAALSKAAGTLMSVPELVTFIQFIYEETLQTLLFTAYQAYRDGFYDVAKDVVDFAYLEVLPEAKTFTSTYGNLNPATKGCFDAFFLASEKACKVWYAKLAKPKNAEGTLKVYTNVEDVNIYVDGKYFGTAGPLIPASGTLPAGSHGVEAKKTGYYTEARSVKIDPNEYQVLKINMKPME